MEIRCSKLARPMVCAGFLFLDYYEPPAGNAAKEGTAAGEYLQFLLEGKLVPQVASNGVFFDNDMKFHATRLAEEIKSRAVTTILCETRIDWQTRSGVWIRGQYDAAFVDKRGYLCIEDLKYGWGIVEVKENWQLLGYAIGEIIRRGQAFEKISLKIHQPRPHHEEGEVREWLLTYEELLEYKEKIEKRFEEIVNGRRDLQTSDKCKYCPAAAEACPAFSRLFYRALEVSTEFFQDKLSNEEIAAQLDQIKRAEEVLKIKLDSLVELGSDRIRQGQVIPNYVLSHRYGNRTWKSNVTPETFKMLTGKSVIEENFMSPAKVEKLGVPKEIVNLFSESKFAGVKLEKKNSTEIGNKIFGNNNPIGG
jgi:hypothetical protein